MKLDPCGYLKSLLAQLQQYSLLVFVPSKNIRMILSVIVFIKYPLQLKTDHFRIKGIQNVVLKSSMYYYFFIIILASDSYMDLALAEWCLLSFIRNGVCLVEQWCICIFASESVGNLAYVIKYMVWYFFSTHRFVTFTDNSWIKIKFTNRCLILD